MEGEKKKVWRRKKQIDEDENKSDTLCDVNKNMFSSSLGLSVMIYTTKRQNNNKKKHWSYNLILYIKCNFDIFTK